MIAVDCACGKSLRVKEELAGRKVRCPGCSQPLSIPAATSEADAFEDVAVDHEWDETPEEPPADAPRRSAPAAKGSKPKKKAKTRQAKGGGLTFKKAFGGFSLVCGVLLLVGFVFVVVTGGFEARMLRGLSFPIAMIGMGMAWLKGETFGG